LVAPLICELDSLQFIAGYVMISANGPTVRSSQAVLISTIGDHPMVKANQSYHSLILNTVVPLLLFAITGGLLGAAVAVSLG
jgi:hypothetical protein